MWLHRKQHWGFPRGAGACEATINAVKKAIDDRTQYFGNVDRLNTLLALIRKDLAGVPVKTDYGKIVRGSIRSDARIDRGLWNAQKDPDGYVSSIQGLLYDTSIRQKQRQTRKDNMAKAIRYREKRREANEERAKLGLAPLRAGASGASASRPDRSPERCSSTSAGCTPSGTGPPTAA